jgi:predicted flavoprotein YhiN
MESMRANSKATIASTLRGAVAERILNAVLGTQTAVIGQIGREERRRIVRDLTEFVLPVARERGFDYAEVTAGGVPLGEIESSTMESRRVSGLYLCGEILDVDGRIGGYNFQWAWASGRLAGRAAGMKR